MRPLWQRSAVTGLPKPNGGTTPITRQESCTKIVELALCKHWEKHLQRALGPHQLGAEHSANAQQAMESLRWVARHKKTAERCPTDITNAFGMLYREGRCWKPR